MKIRSGFVSNSSSSSFLIFTGEKLETKEDIKYWVVDYRSYRKDIKAYRDATKQIKLIDRLSENKSITEKEAMSLKEAVQISLRDTDCFYFPNDGDKGVSFEYTKRQDIVDDVYEALERGKGKTVKFTKDGYPNEKSYKYRTMYKIENWREELKNRKGFMYNVLKSNIRYDLHDVELSRADDNHHRRFDSGVWIKLGYTDGIEKDLDNIVEKALEKHIEYILEEYKDYHVYLLGYCTDSGEVGENEYFLRRGKCFANCDYIIRWECS